MILVKVFGTPLRSHKSARCEKHAVQGNAGRDLRFHEADVKSGPSTALAIWGGGPPRAAATSPWSGRELHVVYAKTSKRDGANSQSVLPQTALFHPRIHYRVAIHDDQDELAINNPSSTAGRRSTLRRISSPCSRQRPCLLFTVAVLFSSPPTAQPDQSSKYMLVYQALHGITL